MPVCNHFSIARRNLLIWIFGSTDKSNNDRLMSFVPSNGIPFWKNFRANEPIAHHLTARASYPLQAVLEQFSTITGDLF